MAALHRPPGLLSHRSQVIAPAMALCPVPRVHPAPLAALPISPSAHRPSGRKQICAASPALPLTPAVLAAAPAADASMLPDSREDAIAQACAAVSANLPAAGGKTGGKKKAPAPAPGFAGASVKLSVEIPVADESAAAAISLAKELVAGLPAPWNSQFTVVTASSASPGAVPLSQLEASPDLLGGCLIITAPQTADIAEIEAALGRWRGPAAILLNAEWAPSGGEDDAGVPPQHAAFARSFDPVYCFMPLLIKAFVVSTQEGVVFRCAAAPGKGGKKAASSGFGESNGSSGDVASPWRVFVQQGGKMEAVARMARRPSSTEIEVAFYNASAAGSPLTKGAKFLKGLMGKEKK